MAFPAGERLSLRGDYHRRAIQDYQPGHQPGPQQRYGPRQSLLDTGNLGLVDEALQDCDQSL